MDRPIVNVSVRFAIILSYIYSSQPSIIMFIIQLNLSNATTFGTKIIDCIRHASGLTMQVVLNVKGPFRTTGSGHNREAVALIIQAAGATIVQVPLYAP